MFEVHIKGKIMPQSFVFFVQNLPQFAASFPTGTNATMTVAIENSAFDVSMQLDSYSEQVVSLYVHRAHELVRAIVDLFSFATGVGLTVFSDTFIDPNGRSLPILPERPLVRGLCTVIDLSPNSPRVKESMGVLLTILSDSEIMMALNDLVVAITIPRTWDINCGRAIEGVRSLMTPPGVDRKLGWQIMRERLNLTQQYLTLITANSQAGRHGVRYSETSQETINEVIKRAWVIMNRFLEYRKIAGDPLPLDKFPLLDDGPAELPQS